MITVVPYDPTWPSTFAVLRERLVAALGTVPVVGIEHVGSTAVPGLAAKPVIDIDIVVAAPDVRAASDALESAGLEPQGDQGIEHRWTFGVPGDWPPSHVYVVLDGCVALRNHLAVRDALRRDPRLRQGYGALKRRLALEMEDVASYVVAKTPLLLRILEGAGFTAAELAEIEAANRR